MLPNLMPGSEQPWRSQGAVRSDRPNFIRKCRNLYPLRAFSGMFMLQMHLRPGLYTKPRWRSLQRFSSSFNCGESAHVLTPPQ